MRRCGLVLLAGAVLCVPVGAQSKLKSYASKYYVIRSDLDRQSVREADLRISLMAEEYHQRTKAFAGVIRQKLPFFLFGDVRGYIAAGGMRNTLGVFTGDRLMAVAGKKLGPQTWQVVQHEGFHQFVHFAIGGDIPAWVDEGLADYFGLAIFTGDGYVTGVVPPRRLAIMRAGLKRDWFKPVEGLMRTTQEMWNAHVELDRSRSGANYLQAWSMVHFLAHADNGKYQKPFGGFIKDVSRGLTWQDAWARNLGRDIRGFEDRWRKYWSELPDNPTAELYARATVATMTSYLGRAFSRRQSYETAEAFFEAARAGELKHHEQDWLPPALLARTLKKIDGAGTWTLKKGAGRPRLICEIDAGVKLIGSFRIRSGRAKNVTVKRTPRKR